MTFAAPLFLLAALAAAIPIALHMINRQKAKELPFSTLRFLKISVQKTRRRKRIHDMLLMAVRAAALLLIAAGLAKPAVTSLGSLWGGSHSAAVIVLDNSCSMGMIDQDRIRFETATGAAAQILDQMTDGDQVALLPTCGPPFPDAQKLDRTQDTVREVLAQCRVSYERANLGLKVRQARELLAKAESPNKQIFVLTDMQKLSWEGLGDDGDNHPKSDLPAGSLANAEPTDSPQAGGGAEDRPIPLIVVDCNRTPKPNVAVQGVDVDATAPIAGLPVKATVTLLNTSTVPLHPRVELLIDGVKEASSPELNAPPEGRVKHEFQFAFKSGGLHRGEVRLASEDGSKFDDRRFFALEVDQSIPVAIVRGQKHEIPYLDDGYYLQQALAPGRSGGWAVQPTMLVADDLMSESLDKYRVIYCVNLPAPKPEAAERLQNYLAAGGSVVWIAGDNVAPDAYNQMNEQAKAALLPAPLGEVRAPTAQDNRDSWHINFLDKTYPAFGHLVEPASLYESVLVYKHVRVAVRKDDASVRVLARLDDGEPLLAIRTVGKGRVLFFGATAHVNWSNLPLRPIFLPFMARLTFELAGVERKFHNIIAGQPIVLSLPDQTTPVGVEVVPPGGETLRLKTEGVDGQIGQTFRHAATYDIGVYVFRLLNTTRATQIAYSVNADPDEADPVKMPEEELRKRLGPRPLVVAENPDDLSSTFALLREGKSLWSFFLGAVLFVLVFETFLSNRLSPKQEEQPLDLPPPGMRRLAKKAS